LLTLNRTGDDDQRRVMFTLCLLFRYMFVCRQNTKSVVGEFWWNFWYS